MKTVLKNFIAQSLFDASAKMLGHLHIKFSPQSKTPILFGNLYFRATSQQMPKQLAEVMGKVKETFFIGTIDEESLKGHQSSYALEKPVDGKYQTMMVFAVDIKHGETLTRTELSTLTRGFNRMASSLPVILFVKNGNRLSLATCERSEFQQDWREGEKLGKVSILRDINCAKPHRGHLDILETLGDKAYATFDELYKHWLEVFSSELLTKKFYTELSEWYAWVIDSGKVKFPNDISTTEDDAKFNHEAVIRLITRLIFVWFLKQKKLIPEDFFNEKAIRDNFIENFDPHSSNTLFYNPEESKYYRLILQNLFFAMLNRPIKDEDSNETENRRFRNPQRFRGGSFNEEFNVNNLMRYQTEFKDGGDQRLLEIANSCVPFLNGGLFECLDHKDTKDPQYGMYFDGFSENEKSLSQLSFPDYFFFGEEVGSNVDLSKWYDDKKKKSVKVRGLINILQSYYFTVEENTPLDQEVSLDPELLGKVFENLLASYNPETDTTARKQTGSFYTPRDIVKYMVDECLIAHLKRTCPSIDESIFRNLFDYSNDNFVLSEEDRKAIMSALYNCKVLDPACGSGAFPMGILQQMVHALRKLDPTNEMWREFILEMSLKKDREAYRVEDEEERNRLRADIEQSFNRQINDPDYARKLYLIENCIYGVDIQPIATQISKLRFFISLVAEQKPKYDDSKNNFGIRPLPNLEAKFVSANTLLPLEKESNIFGQSDSLAKIKKQLAEANHKNFRAKNNKEKRLLRSKIETLRKEYANELFQMGSIGSSSAQLLADWNMFDQNSSAGFFDSIWMFDIEKGFDIVIGNPPYVQLQKATGERVMDKNGKIYDVKLGDIYENKRYETYAKTGDIYCLFYEQGRNLVQEGGIVCYITSNKWMRAGYGEKLRGFFAKKTNPQILIDFGGIKVFESATVDTNIFLFSKDKNRGETLSAAIGKDKINGFINLSNFVQQNAVKVEFKTSESWVILSPIELSIKRKIESVGVPLKDWDINIYRGILTGYNEAFIISTEKRNEILNNCQTPEERKRTEELIRPILRGRDIKRYGYDWANLWLIWIPWHFPFHLDPTIKGASKEAEEAFKFQFPAVYHHLFQYKEKLSARNKAETGIRYEWYALQRWGANYWDDFSKPKIMYPNMTKFMPFYYDEKGFFQNDKSFFITGSNIGFLTAFFNSSLFKWCFSDNFPKLGENGRELRKIFFDKIPVIQVDEEIDSECRALVKLLQNYWDKELANRINQIIFDLYELTAKEREIISDLDFQ